MQKTTAIIGGCAAVVIGGFAYVCFNGEPLTVPGMEAPTKPVKVAEQQKAAQALTAKARRAKRLAQATEVREKPTFAIDDDDEAKLNEEQRKLIEEIRQALEEDEAKTLIRLVTKLQAMNEWPDGIPLSIRKAAIEALSYFGKDGLAEVVGFVADENPEIQEMTMDAIEEALADANGDRELSQMLIMACKVVNDPEAIESYMMEIDGMRNSVAIETIKQIYATGTQAAKDALAEAIESLTGEEDITIDKLDDWYNDPSGENRDGEDDEEFYGPDKDEED